MYSNIFVKDCTEATYNTYIPQNMLMGTHDLAVNLKNKFIF